MSGCWAQHSGSGGVISTSLPMPPVCEGAGQRSPFTARREDGLGADRQALGARIAAGATSRCQAAEIGWRVEMIDLSPGELPGDASLLVVVTGAPQTHLGEHS